MQVCVCCMLGEGSLGSVKFAVFLKSSFGSLPFHLIREKASASGVLTSEREVEWEAEKKE